MNNIALRTTYWGDVIHSTYQVRNISIRLINAEQSPMAELNQTPQQLARDNTDEQRTKAIGVIESTLLSQVSYVSALAGTCHA